MQLFKLIFMVLVIAGTFSTSMKELAQKLRKKKKTSGNMRKIKKYFLNTLADTLLINTLDLTNEMDKGNMNESIDQKIQ